MKRVIYTDENGYKRATLIKDTDGLGLAPYGIPVSMPVVEDLDWDNIKKEIHNMLMERGLFTWDDVQRQQKGLTSTINSVLKRRLVNLYRNFKR